MTQQGRRTILVVDDDAAVRESLYALLERQGYRVYSAENGRQALGVVAWRKPDLVLLDIAMPVMDGWTALRELRASPATASVPVLIVTALGHPEDEREALDAGADGYMVKPFLGPELELRVAELLWRER